MVTSGSRDSSVPQPARAYYPVPRLEKHLAQVCENHSVKINKKHPAIGDLNNALKEADVIDTPRWRANQHLADIRNLCDHGKAKEPTEEQVTDLVEGVEKVLKTLF